jgi:hypothetical protein
MVAQTFNFLKINAVVFMIKKRTLYYHICHLILKINLIFSEIEAFENLLIKLTKLICWPKKLKFFSQNFVRFFF